MTPTICGLCNRNMYKKKIKKVLCAICNTFYHKSCVNMSNKTFKNNKEKVDNFFCQPCINKNLPFSNINDSQFSQTDNNTNYPEFSNDTSNNINKNFFDRCNAINTPYDDENHHIHINSKYYDVMEFNNLKIRDSAFGFFHLNIASLSKHFDNLYNLITLMKFKFPIIGLTEHKIGKNLPVSNVNIPGYNFCFDHTKSTHGGTGFFISEKLTFKKRDDLQIVLDSSLESTFIEIVLSNRKNILCGCIYRHPHMSINEFNEKYLSPLLEKLIKEDKFCVLMGDFNLDLIKKDSKSSISDFYNIMCSYFFAPFILQPTRVTETSQTLIDNIFLNSFEYSTFSGNITAQISDHLIQFVVLNDLIVPLRHQNTNQFKRNFKNFDKVKFKEDISNIDLNALFSQYENDVNSLFNSFFEAINTILDKHAPLVKTTKKELSLLSKPWINKEIKHLMWERDKCFKKYCHNKNTQEKQAFHDTFKKLRNQVNFEIKKSKKSYYESYFEKHKSDSSSVWKGIKSLITLRQKSKEQPTKLSVNNKLISDQTEIANIFNDFFVNIGPTLSNKIGKTDISYTSFLTNRCLNSLYLKPTDKNEIMKLIAKLNQSKALGPNSIPVNILKDNSDIFSEPLSKLINLSFQQGIFPETLKTAQVSPVHKKDDVLLYNNYRPISLLSIFSKLFEKAMYNRLYSFLTKYNLIYQSQYGFRAKHSTEHALINFIELTKSYLDNGSYVCGIFVDLQKAFDTVDHQILINKLSHYGIRGIANDWLSSFLTNRQQYVSISGFYSSTKQILCGVPQGSTLGPLLFLLYINDLHCALQNVLYIISQMIQT